MTTTESGITVGMPVWNAMPWLPEAMESLFHQTTEAFEILVIADSSTDGSTEYLRTLRDHRLRVVEQAHAGLTASPEPAAQGKRARPGWPAWMRTTCLIRAASRSCRRRFRRIPKRD